MAKPISFASQWQTTLADYITALAWSPDGQFLAVSSAQGEVGLWQAPNQWHLLKPGDGQSINGLGFSADGHYLAAAGQRGQVILWQVQVPDLPVCGQLDNPGTWVDQLAWHPVAPLLAFGVGDIVQLWDFPAPPADDPGATLIKALPFQQSSVLNLHWHPQGSHLAVSGHKGVKVWSQEDWDAPAQFTEVPGASVCVRWSPQGRYFASGNLDRTLTVVDWGNPPPWYMQGFPGKVRQVAWSDLTTKTQSPLLAAACAEGVTVWEREAAEAGVWKGRVLTQHRQTVTAVAFQPQTFLLASAGQDGQLCLWHQAKSLAQTLKNQQGFATLAWHPGGSLLATGGQAGELTLWAPSLRGRGFQT